MFIIFTLRGRATKQIDLVLDEPVGRAFFELRHLCAHSSAGRYVSDPQNQIRFRGAGAGAAYTFLLDRLAAAANARRVQDGERIAVEIEVHFDDIARRAGVRRSSNCDYETVTQALASPAIG